MTKDSPVPTCVPSPAERPARTVASTERPATATVLATASIITAAFMGSVIVTPLYSLYQRKFGFSEITLTLVYAIYVVGNVAALLLFGQVSDQAGRKRTALPALALAGASAVVFLVAGGTPWLYGGRLLIGLAVGILSGTGTAWLAELFGPGARPTATVTAATANLTGIAIAVARTDDTRPGRIGTLRELRVRPRIAVPRDRCARSPHRP